MILKVFFDLGKVRAKQPISKKKFQMGTSRIFYLLVGLVALVLKLQIM